MIIKIKINYNFEPKIIKISWFYERRRRDNLIHRCINLGLKIIEVMWLNRITVHMTAREKFHTFLNYSGCWWSTYSQQAIVRTRARRTFRNCAMIRMSHQTKLICALHMHTGVGAKLSCNICHQCHVKFTNAETLSAYR